MSYQTYYMKQRTARRTKLQKSVNRKEAIRNLVGALLIFGAWVLIETLVYHIQYGW